ncbi:MAG: glycosyltransferase family 2 protein [Pseudomonadota bacterium]
MTPPPSPPDASLPLSVFVIARDEEARLGRTLAAVSFAAEILVLDSGSTDGTVAVAEGAGATVHVTDWPGYGPQKARAEGMCRHDWVLNVDADEVVTPALAAEIAALFAGGPPPPAAYALRILNVYPGDDAPRPFANDYRVVRLYHRRAGRYRAHPLFDRVDLVEGQAARRLKAPIHHFPFVDWAGLVAKENRYTSYVAESAAPRRSGRLRWRLLAEPILVFLKFWLLRRHVFGGWKGFFFALTVAYVRTLRLAKMLERAERSAPRAAGEK